MDGVRGIDDKADGSSSGGLNSSASLCLVHAKLLRMCRACCADDAHVDPEATVVSVDEAIATACNSRGARSSRTL